MRALAGLLFVGLVACGPLPTPQSIGYRDLSAPISSSTRFEEKKFAGQWFTIATFRSANRPEVRAVLGPPIWVFEAEVGPVFNISTGGYPPTPRPYREVGVAQFAPVSSLFKNQPPIWVLWVDEDFQTAVLGTPDGTFGEIINRTPNLRADRFEAAREVLAFNGYDVSKLRKVTP